MGIHQKLLWTILRGRSDSNIRFADLQALLIDLGFDERFSGTTSTAEKGYAN
jgi:hypothetical protein